MLPTQHSVLHTLEETAPRRTRSNDFSHFKYFLVVLGSSLIAFSAIHHINWPLAHSTVLGNSPSPRSPRESAPILRHGESAPTLNHPIKPNSISLVSLQTTFERVMDDLGIDSFAHSLKSAENNMRGLGQRAKHSSLPNKDPLVEQLYLIASTAKETGRSFQRFSSRVRSTLDQIVVANQYILLDVESQVNEVVSNLDSTPNRFAPALLKPGVLGLLKEANVTVLDLDRLQIELNFASGMATQLKEYYIHQKAQKKNKEFDDDREFFKLENICSELERASTQVKRELSLFHRVSNDLHIVHDQLSTADIVGAHTRREDS
ncbi:hypothetical protein RSOLAG22IIIB_08128 [Rhizoctonia solani]|uniref:Uncharacterized protein n=1 Tax=Rhizoctonia solani TaxID=456999 RepID=A0A0K6FRN8_9AGAM|nr:hypothetical protein RSOLAG22IIIB_08128 [Rhizoctonia solani]